MATILNKPVTWNGKIMPAVRAYTFVVNAKRVRP